MPYGARPITANNVCARPANRDRVASTRDRARSPTRPTAVPADRANKVFTDRNGDVYRRNSDGSWDRRDKGGWTRNEGVPGTADVARRAPAARPSMPDVGQPPTGPSTLPSPGSGPSTRPSPGAQPSTRSAPRVSARPSTMPAPGGSLSRDYDASQRGSRRSQQMNRA